MDQINTNIPDQDSTGKAGKRRMGNFRKKWRYDRARITGILVAVSLVVLVAVLLLANRFDNTTGVPEGSSDSVTVSGTASTVRIDIPFFAQEQYLVGRGVLAYMESDLTRDVTEVLGQYRKSGQRMDAGYPVAIDFDIKGMPVGYSVAALRVEVSEDTAFTQPRVFPLEIEDRTVDVYHLKTDTQYYFRIILTVSDGSEVFAQGSFKTAASPRILSIEGLTNVRDIGGWKTATGKTVRQGLLYRGSEMDGNVEKTFLITEAGKADMLDVLGIRTEPDLRYNVMTNALGDTVEHTCYATAMYAEMLEQRNEEKTVQIFTRLADPEIYPAYLHCTYGLDKTGTIVTMLGMLLGMSKDDLIREQELSALYHGGANTDKMEEFIAEVETWEGRTLAQKMENYLKGLGITQEQIDSIREIFLTD